VEATVTNEGDRARTVDPTALESRAEVGDSPRFFADVGREVHEGVTVADAEATLGTPPLAGATVEPGEQRRGWLLAPVARKTASEGGIEVGIQGGPSDRADGGDGPPETVWQVVPEGGVDLPEFDVVSVSAPDQAPNMTTAEFWVTVENVGDAPGTYRDVLEITGNHEWDPVGRIAGEVAAGERMGLSGEFFVAYADEQGLALQRGTTEEVEQPPTHGVEGAQAICVGSWLELPFPYEETLELTNGTLLSFTRSEEVPGYNLTPTSGVSGPFLLVEVVAEMPRRAVGRGLGKRMIPWLEDFRSKVHPEWDAEKPNEIAFGPLGSSTTIVDPVQGPLYPPEPPKEPENGRLSGWIPFIKLDPNSKYNRISTSSPWRSRKDG